MENSNVTPSTQGSQSAAPTPSPASGALNTAPPPSPPEMFEMVGAVRLTTDETHTLAKDMVRHGHLPNIEAANQMLARENLPPLNPPDAYKTPEQIHYEKNYSTAKPQEFDLPPIRPGAPNEKAQRESHEKFRDILVGLQLPRELGNSLIQTAQAESKQIENKSESEFRMWKSNQDGTLRSLWGDKHDENLSLAKRFLNENPKGAEIRDWLSKSGMGNSASIIVQIHQQAQRLQAMGKI